MSTTVDSKVVEMKFDNKDFEANVKNSMSTLDKLKAKLDFKGAAKGLDNIQKASEKIDFSGMANGIDVASVKFSALQVAGVTAITNITNSLLGLASNIVQTFAVQPKMDGFNEYELKMGSIQTIMASTGASLDEVNGYLEELNTYADKTIYSFSDMTENIGKFTNAGVDLKTAVKAIQGISNEAAISGANANEASRAMYNFAQAISAGSVKLIDWKSIELANMGTVEFKNELIKTAVELGTLVEQEGQYISTTTDMNGNVSDAFTATTKFNDSLSAQWLTTDVLTTTLSKYSDETTELGKKAFASAQDVKTFSMMMDTLKEAAGSGWATTWQLIFGDFEQAKNFWTTLTNSFSNIIQTIANVRNGFLEKVMGGGSSWSSIASRITDAGVSLDSFQSKLIEIGNSQGIAVEEIINTAGSLEDAFKTGALSGQLIIDTIKAISDTAEVATQSQEDYTEKLRYFQDVVDNVWNGTYYNGQERVEALTAAGYDYAKVQDLVNKTVDGHRLTLEDLNIEQMKSIGYTQEEIDALHALAAEADQSGSSLNDLLQDLTKMSGRDLFTKSISNTVSAITNIFDTVKNTWTSIFTEDESVDMVRRILEGIYKLSQRFLDWTTRRSDELSRSLAGILSIIKLISDGITGALSFALKALGKGIDGANIDILSFTAKIGDNIVAFTEWIRTNEALQTIIGKIQDGVLFFIDILVKLKQKVTDFFKSLMPIAEAQESIDGTTDSLTALDKRVDKFKQTLNKVGIVVTNFKNKIKELCSENDVLASAMVLIKKGLEELKDTASKWIDGIHDFLDETKPLEKLQESAKEALDNIGQAFINAGAQAQEGKKTVAEACSDIAKTMTTSVGQAFGIASVSDIFNNLIAFIQDFGSKFSETFTGIKKDTDETIGNLGDALSNINWSPIIAIVGASGLIYTMNQATNAMNTFANSFSHLTKVQDAAAGFIKQGTTLLKSFDKILSGMKFNLYAEGLMKVAIAIGILAGAFFVVGQMDVEQMKAAGIALGGIIALMIALMAVSGFGKIQLSTEVFLSMAAMFASIAIVFVAIAKSMDMLSKVDKEGMITALEGLAGIVAAISVITVVLGKALQTIGAKSLIGFAAVAVALGFAVNMIAKAIDVIGEMDGNALDQGLHVVAVLAVYLTALIAVSGKSNIDGIESIGVMAIALGASLILVLGAIKIAGNMEPGELQQGIIVVGVLGSFLAAIIAVVTRNTVAIAKVGGSIIGITIAIGLLVGISKLAAKLSEEEFEKGAKVIGVFGAMCAALLIAVSRLGGEKGAAYASLSILSMSFAIGSLVVVCYLCSLLDDEALNRGLRAVAVIGSIAALMASGLKGATEAYKSIIAMTVMLGVLVAAVSILGTMDSSALARGTVAISAMMLCFALLMQSIKIIEKENFASFVGTIAIMGLVVAALTGILALMCSDSFNSDKAIPNAIALGLLLIAFSAALKIIASSKGDFASAYGGMAAMTLVAVALAGVLGVMEEMNIQNGIANAIALGILLNAFAVAMRIMDGVGEISKSAITAAAALSVICTMLAVSLGIMTAMNVQNAIVNATALALLVNALSVACVILGKIKAVSPAAVLAMTALTAICLALSGILAIMEALNIESAIPNAIALSELVLALSAACVLLAAAGSFGPAGITGIEILVALIVSVGTLMAVIGELNKQIPEMETAINSAIPILGSIGDGLGEMIGHFVGGTLESLSSHLPGIADNLSGFLANLDPFVKKAESLGGKDFSGLGQLSQAILTLAQAELLKGIGDIVDFFTGGSSFEEDLVSYASALTEFSNNCTGINQDGAVKAAAVAPLIATVLNSLPEEGGLKSMVFGSSSDTMKNLSDNLSDFGNAVVNFSNTIGDTDLGNVDKGVEAGKKVAQLLGTDMPTTGGLAGMIFGDSGNSFKNLQENLDPFGEAIKSFANKVSGIDVSGVDPAKWAGEVIAGFMANDTNQKGLSYEVPSNIIASFGRMGSAISAFSERTANSNFANVSAAISAMQTVCDFIKNDLQDFSEGNVGGFVASINLLATANINSLVTAFQNGSSQMSEAGMNLMSALGNGMKMGLASAMTVASSAVMTIRNSIVVGGSDFTTIGVNFMTSIANGISSAVSSVTNAALNAENSVETALRDKASAFLDLGKLFMNQMASGIASGNGDIKNAVSTAMSGVISYLRDYNSQFQNAGYWCISGLAIGIRSGRSEAISAASEVASAALKAANDKLKVASPSKEFMKTGRWSVLGLAKGMRDNAYVAGAAGRSLAKTIMDSTNDSLSLIGKQSFSNLGIAHITPVVDYSGIGKYSGHLDLSASLGRVVTEPIQSSFEIIEQAQRAIDASNERVVNSINGLREDMSSYNDGITNMENAMYVDGKKLASSIAKPMNRELGTLSKRGRL